ncbi:hypothetical protein FKM82_024401 [Ascaphus truei]
MGVPNSPKRRGVPVSVCTAVRATNSMLLSCPELGARDREGTRPLSVWGCVPTVMIPLGESVRSLHLITKGQTQRCDRTSEGWG